LSGTNVISSGGILVSPAAGSVADVITGGTLEGASNADLDIEQFDTTGTLTIASTIANASTSASLTKSGPGTLILSATNSYTTGTFVNAGTLTASNNGSLSSGAVTVNSGGTLNVTATGNLGSGAITVNSGGTLTFNSGAASTLGNSITNSGTVNIAANETFSFAGTTQSFTQNAGNLTVSGAGSLTLRGNTFTDNGGTITGTVALDNSGGSTTPTLGIGAGATSGAFLFTGTSTNSTG